MRLMINNEQLTGRSTGHLREIFPGYFLHDGVVAPYLQLVDKAKRAGIHLRLASGFRSFDRQLAIWDAKAKGERPVLGEDGEPLDFRALDDREKVFAILRWSALPGASRHHWGSDIDVWDSAAVGRDYRLQLTPCEYDSGGPFYHCACWLAGLIRRRETAFFRPYTGLSGDVAAEPWHLSYRPIATAFAQAMTVEVLAGLIAGVDIQLKASILNNIDEIHARFVSV